jgi:hypothetical protein
MLFVIAYDRNKSEILTLERFEDSDRASAELLYRTTLREAMRVYDGVEVNIFEAAGEEVLRQTHARYFQTAEQTLEEMRRAV